MRIRCTCGRNLADATLSVIQGSDYNRDWVWPINHYLRAKGVPAGDWRDTAALMVASRPGVNQRDHHMRPDGDSPRSVTRERTYSWTCPRCKQHWQRTAEKVALGWGRLWTKPGAPKPTTRAVVVAVLDVDM